MASRTSIQVRSSMNTLSTAAIGRGDSGSGFTGSGRAAKRATVVSRAAGICSIERALLVSRQGKDFVVQTSRATFVVRLSDGKFPEWRRFFPQRNNATKIGIVIGPFLSGIRQAAAATSSTDRAVKIQFQSGKAVLTASEEEIGSSRVEVPLKTSSPDL